MRTASTKYFGPMDYEESAVLEFAEGLPGFDSERRFVALRQPASDPLVFLQSLSHPELCFVSLLPQWACPDYQLSLTAEDRGALGLATGAEPAVGRDLLCLTILALDEASTTVNLLAPIVVNLRNRQGRQAVQPPGRYSHRHILSEQAPVTDGKIRPN